jgi:hypothetical protein
MEIDAVNEESSKKVKPKAKPKVILCNISCCKYPVIEECLTDFGFKVTESSTEWTLFWIDTGVSIERILDM